MVASWKGVKGVQQWLSLGTVPREKDSRIDIITVFVNKEHEGMLLICIHCNE